MKSTKKHFRLEDGEYLITPKHHSSMKYKILFDGKEIHDVVGIVRTVRPKIKDFLHGKQSKSWVKK